MKRWTSWWPWKPRTSNSGSKLSTVSSSASSPFAWPCPSSRRSRSAPCFENWSRLTPAAANHQSQIANDQDLCRGRKRPSGFCVFSLSANGVGGEGRGEVVLISTEKLNPLTLTLSPLGRGEGNLGQAHDPKINCPLFPAGAHLSRNGTRGRQRV